MRVCIIGLIAICFLSCKSNKEKEITALLQEWGQKEILFPQYPVFSIQGNDTVDYSIQNRYKILTYIDSVGCTSCKLKLKEWKAFIDRVDSLKPDSVQFLFFFSPKKRMEIYQTLLVEKFKYPICIDEYDSINILNHFPSHAAFQTFLLDKTNKVLAIGNPIYNPKVKDLYIKIISGENTVPTSNEKLQTSIRVDKTLADMGTFPWQEKRIVEFNLSNVGEDPLVIDGVSTSCGCTTVEYSKEPVRAGKTLNLKVTYQAERPEHFNKTLTVYCNAKDSPFELKITGNAK